MLPLFQLLPTEIKLSKSSVNSERASIIKTILDELNLTRPCTYYYNGKKKTAPKMTARGVACLVGYLKENSDLYFLHSMAKTHKSYSSYFFWATKSTKCE